MKPSFAQTNAHAEDWGSNRDEATSFLGYFSSGAQITWSEISQFQNFGVLGDSFALNNTVCHNLCIILGI